MTRIVDIDDFSKKKSLPVWKSILNWDFTWEKSEDFIYFYKSQIPELLKILKKVRE